MGEPDGCRDVAMIDATRALIDDWTLLCDSLGGQAMTRAAGGVALLATGVPFPTLNLALAYGRDATSEAASGLLDALQAAGLPHCLQLRPGAAPELIRLAEDRGLESQEEIPLMVATTTELASVAAPPILIRELAAEEVETHVALAASGFDAPQELFRSLVTPAVLAAAGVRAYAGWMDGRPVTTALSITQGDHVGIYNVGTPRDYRRRGFGSAVTARAAADAFKQGASYAYLQSSAAGLGAYSRLGFRTIETWRLWTSPRER